MINNKNKVKYIKIVLFLFISVFGVMGLENQVKATSTCKSQIAYPGKTSAKVNIRKKAGTRYKSYGLVKKNETLTILGYTTNQGITWYKCKTKVNGKTRTGYISGAYIIKTSKPKGVVNSKVITSLNVRKSTRTSSKSLLKIKRNSKVTVYGIRKVSGKYWYKIRAKYKKKARNGYVYAKYITISSKKNSHSISKPQEKPSQSEVKNGYVNEKVTSFLNVRENPSTTSSVLTRIPKFTPVSIYKTEDSWYRISVTYNNKTIQGYAAKEYITLGTHTNSNSSENNDKKEEVSTTPDVVPQTDQQFETSISIFPESYKASLRALHVKYPNWKFVGINTNLDWNTVITNESVVGRNVIQSNYPRNSASLAPFSYLSTKPGAYNWSTDKYTVKDGSNWYSADSSVIAYYMDPRNFLNDVDIFQFEALAYDVSQKSSVVQAILNNTFMKGNYKVKDIATNKTVSGSYKTAFMDGGKKAVANPYFLATRSKQEVGSNGSPSTSGNYKGYEGYYNFYNIGAFDGKDAVAKGLSWAAGGSNKSTTYGRPWTNPYKAIVGGAQFMAMNYINKGQNTLYFQKFNVVPTDPRYLYLHQYMTNVQAPFSEGRITRNGYNTMGIMSDSMVFYIPFYNNMPSSPSSLPTVAGNPNPYLADISIMNGSSKLALTPTFSKPKSDGTLDNATYSLVVPNAVSQITINAKAISKYTTISGTGTFNLDVVDQPIAFNIIGIAQNGTKQVYTVNITRSSQQ